MPTKSVLSLSAAALLALVMTLACAHVADAQIQGASEPPYSLKADIVIALPQHVATASEFKKQMNFAFHITKLFHVGSAETSFALVTFGSELNVDILLGMYQDGKSVREAILATTFTPSKIGESTESNIAKAIEGIRDQVFTKPYGARASKSAHRFVILLLPDGAVVNENALAEAKAAKKKGIEIIAVVVGKGFDLPLLNKLVSIPADKHVFKVTDYDLLNGKVDEVGLTVFEESNKGEAVHG